MHSADAHAHARGKCFMMRCKRRRQPKFRKAHSFERIQSVELANGFAAVPELAPLPAGALGAASPPAARV